MICNNGARAQGHARAQRRKGARHKGATAQGRNGFRMALENFGIIATVLRLAAVAKSKQYCLSDAEARGGASCIACASFKTVAPKLSAALIFLCLL